MEELKTYTVVKSLHHDGKRRRLGSTVQLTEEQAAPLIELGVVTFGAIVVVPVPLAPETLVKLNLTELTTYAQAHGVTPAEGASKADIIAALTAAGA